MSLLISLYLDDNNLSGSLPSNNSSIHSMLPRVQNLSLESNQLSGNIPAGLCHCHDLSALSLSVNQFSGKIPEELGKLKRLRLLYLADNNLTGTIPTSSGNLTNLLGLELGDNSIHGVIPEELSSLSNLQHLDLAECQLTGSIRVHCGNMTHLRLLSLGGNALTGGLGFLDSNCRALEDAYLWGNELNGSLPGNLSRNIQRIEFSQNHIMGQIPVELGNMSRLEVLDLGDNELVGTIPSQITMLEKLQHLSLQENRIYGSIPHEIGQLTMLNLLYLDWNNISGPIPDSVGNISSLERLLLGFNSLSSKIPESMWSLTRLIELSLLQNFLRGFMSSGVGNITFVTTFDVSMNQLSGEIPIALKELQMLTYLDLSNNSFDGQIPPSFSELISIQVLNLSHNNLSGIIPGSLANLRYLRNINISFNKLEGKIPSSGIFSNISIMSLVGNAALCGEPRLGFPPCSIIEVSNTRSRAHLLRYILPAIASAIILVLAFFIIFFKLHRKQAKNLAPADTPYPNAYRLISYHELVRATNNFSETNLLGRGSFGSVYQGCLDDGLLTAIKVLNLEVDGASRSFDAECSALRMVRHRNLVKIITTCSNLDFRALILQFMPNGSLERWLYSANYCLSLLQRVNIVIDVASALDHLHHHHSHVVLHCDLKPSNILLDEEMTAHVSDFGIAKLLASDGRSATSTSTPGTIGYIAPEYASTGRVSRKGDVYSFGILLLEMFTQKKPTDPMFGGESSLRRWICDAYPDALLEIVDSSLLKDGSGNEMPSEDQISLHACLSSIMELGIICSKDSPKERLAMKEVVPKLQKIKADYLSMFPIV